MKALDKKVDIHIFPDAGHGFENPNNEQAYRAEDTAKAQKITEEFLLKNLK
jgi:carboxymethylenebutenolidase